MFMGPLDASIAWSENGLEGSRRFLERVWRLYIDEDTGKLKENIQASEDDQLTKVYHQTVKKVTQDYENLHFNTAISQMMIFLNEARSADLLPLNYAKGFVQLLAPIAPHLMEELWQKLGHSDSLSEVSWPTYEEALTVDDEIEIVIQINGKVREKVNITLDMPPAEMEELALANETIKAELEDKTVRKVIAIPNRLVNIVAN